MYGMRVRREVRVMEGGECLFFFNDTATTEIYTLSLHDALPIWVESVERVKAVKRVMVAVMKLAVATAKGGGGGGR